MGVGQYGDTATTNAGFLGIPTAAFPYSDKKVAAQGRYNECQSTLHKVQYYGYWYTA